MREIREDRINKIIKKDIDDDYSFSYNQIKSLDKPALTGDPYSDKYLKDLNKINQLRPQEKESKVIHNIK